MLIFDFHFCPKLTASQDLVINPASLISSLNQQLYAWLDRELPRDKKQAILLGSEPFTIRVHLGEITITREAATSNAHLPKPERATDPPRPVEATVRQPGIHPDPANTG